MKEQGNNGLLALGIAVLAIVSGGWLYFYTPLESQRPDQQSRDHGGASVNAMVRARLWQDPFEPVQSHWDYIVSSIASNKSIPPDVAMPMTIGEFAQRRGSQLGSQLRLVVLLPGGPYAEDVEQRRRYRYAVISALTEAEYVPEDGERIGYFTAPSFSPEGRRRSEACAPTKSADAAQDAKSIPAESKSGAAEESNAGHAAVHCYLDRVLVAYEFFKPSVELNQLRNNPGAVTADVRDLGANWKSVLVLWVNEEDTLLGFPHATPDGDGSGVGSPLDALVQLLTALDVLQDGVGDISKKVRTVVLGPSSSAMLARMYKGKAKDRGESSADDVQEAGVDFVNAILDDGLSFRDLALRGIPQQSARTSGPVATFAQGNEEKAQTERKRKEIGARIIALMVGSIDDYLDYGLPHDGRRQLADCLNGGQALLPCLDRLFPDLSDSDIHWRDTASGGWRYPPYQVADWIVRVASSSGPVDENVVELLLFLHTYLDSGLELIDDTEGLGACLGDRAKLVADCLSTEMPEVQDTDPNWAETAGLWWAAAKPQGTATGNQTSRVEQNAELEPRIRTRLKQQRDALIVLSPRATAPLDMLFPNAGSRILDKDVAKELGISQFHSEIASDDRVIRNVLLELDARGACRHHRPVILVLSEQDADYGRFMAEIVARQARALAPQVADGQAVSELRSQVAHDRSSNHVSCHFNVVERTYLRGVDGEIPPFEGTREHRDRAEAAAADVPDRAFDSSARGERAYGVAQLDYIRRLADEIARPRPGDEEMANVVAVAVLGSDVYDKLLILQSLRQRLPWLTFFTTDLDARLGDRDALKWTRNLLVASAYPLSAPRRKGPPFRDAYQTAMYHAVEHALRIDGDQVDWASALPPPRLFEIGRNGPVDITPVTGCSCGNAIRPPEPTSAELLGGMLLLLSPLLAFTVTIARLARQTSRDDYGRWHASLVHAAWASGGAAFVIGLLLMSWNLLFDEPWLPQHGITSVPTFTLYLATIVFAACLLRLALGRIDQWNRDTTDAFRLVCSPSPKTDQADRARNGARWLAVKKELKEFHEARTISKWTRDLNGSTKSIGSEANAAKVEEIWCRYLALGRIDARLWRVVPLTVLWSAVAILIVLREPAPLLTHGVYFLLDAVRLLTIVAVVGTVFFCTDALHLGQIAIRALADHDVGGWHKDKASEMIDEYAWRRRRSMDLIVEITETIGPIVVFPFILLVLLIVARSSFFEGWVWTPNLILVYTAFSAHILLRALRFQFEAASCRERVLRDLAKRRVELAQNDSQLRQLDLIIDEVDAIRRGAFVPWTRHPILQSIALPSGGIGLVSIVNALLG